MIIYYIDILFEYCTDNTKKSIFDYVDSFICDNVDYFYNLDYKIDNFKINNCIIEDKVKNRFVILEELENGNCEIKFANREYIDSSKKNRSYLESLKEFLRTIEFREGELRTKTKEQKIKNMPNYSINLRSFYKECLCSSSSSYEDSNSGYLDFVNSFIKDNEEFFLERGFNLDYFTVENALKFPILMTNRLREPRSLGFTSETSAKSYDRIVLNSLSKFMNEILNHYPTLDKAVEINEIKESKLNLETITSTLNNTCSLLLIRRRKKIK